MGLCSQYHLTVNCSVGRGRDSRVGLIKCLTCPRVGHLWDTYGCSQWDAVATVKLLSASRCGVANHTKRPIISATTSQYVLRAMVSIYCPYVVSSYEVSIHCVHIVARIIICCVSLYIVPVHSAHMASVSPRILPMWSACLAVYRINPWCPHHHMYYNILCRYILIT